MHPCIFDRTRAFLDAQPCTGSECAGCETPSRYGFMRSQAREDEAVIGTDPQVTTSAGKAPGAEWELRTFLELGALPSAVPCARLHTRQVLWEWQLSPLADTAELIVSELVTNAVQASAGLTGSRRSGRGVPGVPPVRLWLFSDRRRGLVQ